MSVKESRSVFVQYASEQSHVYADLWKDPAKHEIKGRNDFQLLKGTQRQWACGAEAQQTPWFIAHSQNTLFECWPALMYYVHTQRIKDMFYTSKVCCCQSAVFWWEAVESCGSQWRGQRLEVAHETDLGGVTSLKKPLLASFSEVKWFIFVKNRSYLVYFIRTRSILALDTWQHLFF